MAELDDEIEKPKRNWMKYLWYTGLFLFSFFVFFLFTFPYGIVKEAIVGEISQATGMNVRVKDLGPSFLIGVDAADVRIATQDNLAQVELRSVDVTLSVLSLLIGRVTVNAEVVSKNNGVLDASASWGMLQLITQRSFVPTRIDLESRDFELGPLVNVLLREKSKTANDMVKDLMTQINFQGNLTGKAEMKLAIDEPIQSTGTVDLHLNKASLDLSNPNLVVARQSFEKALVKGNLQGGKLTIDPTSALNSQELKVAFKGTSVLRNPFDTSLLDFSIGIRLEGTLKENFGFIMSVIGGGDGFVDYKINGSLGRPNFQGSAG